MISEEIREIRIADFGPWLKRELEYKKMSQAQLAREAGISKNAVNAYVKCKMWPTVYTLLRILNVFELTIRIVEKE
jgi:transcriptional regulator with XRE-family HTH domain